MEDSDFPNVKPDATPILTLHHLVDFPGQMSAHDRRVPLAVRLTLEKAAATVADETLPIEFVTSEPQQVLMVCNAEGFVEETGDLTRTILVYQGRDSQPAVFLLTPDPEVGPGVRRISLDFYHRERLAGTVSFQVEVRDRPPIDNTRVTPLPVIVDQAKDGSVTESVSGDLVLAAPDSPKPDFVLRITLSADRRRLSYTLHSPPGKLGLVHQSMGSVMIQSDPRAFLDNTLQRLSQTAGASRKKHTEAKINTDREKLQEIGWDLYEQLFTPQLRLAYRGLHELRERDKNLSLLVVSDEPWIPWEMVLPHEDNLVNEDFLCAQFRMTRWLDGRGLPDSFTLHQARVVVPQGDLPSVKVEQDYFSQQLPPGVSFDGQWLDTVQQVKDTLRQAATQLLHFIYHGDSDYAKSTEPVLLLKDETLVPSQIIGAMRSGVAASRPLVFFNASVTGETGFALTHIGGWAERFIRAGASAFIGPLWEVNDELAAQFAIHFYDQLWDGQPLGEAFFRARGRVREQAPEDPTWLAYALWGDPNMRVQLAGADEERAGSYGLGKPAAQSAAKSPNTSSSDVSPFRSVSQPKPEDVRLEWLTLANDARIWFVSANPEEGTDWDELFAQDKPPVHWTKVRNPVGQRNISLARAGDLALAYSSAGRQEIVGLARVMQDADEQPDGRWAVWIEPLVHLERSVKLEELRQATPDLAHVRNPMSSFSPVTYGQWRTLRELLAERNSDQRELIPLAPGEAAPALSWSPPLFSGDLRPGGRATVQYALSNTGTAPLRGHEPLTIEATWRMADQPADREPSGHQTWRVSLNADLRPGEALPVAELSLNLPDAAGSYRVELLAHADLWGDDMRPATTISQVDIGLPALPRRHGLAVEEVTISPFEPAPGVSMQVALRLRNSGDVAWEAEDILTVTPVWRDAGGDPVDTAPVQEHLVGAATPPGEPVTLPLDAIAAPPQPGDYQLTVTVGCDSWDVSATGSAPVAVQLPAPTYGAALTLNRRPPATLWPGQRFEVAGQVSNSGVEVWGEREAQADASVHAPPAAAASLKDSPRWLPPAQPGETLAVQWEGAAPEQPGSGVLSVTVSRIEPAQPPLELARLESALAVVDISTLPLASLTEEAPAGLPARVQAQRLREIGRRLADPAMDAQVRSQAAHAHLLPGLSDADASVSREALAALASLRGLDPKLDAALAEELAASDQTQRALPELVQDPALPTDARRWLEAHLPQEVEERQNSQGQTVLVLPAYVASVQPDLRAPEHTAVVDISPKEVTLRYDSEDYVSPNAMAEPGWQDKASSAEAESPRAYGALLFEAIFNIKHSGGKGPTIEGYFTARKRANRRLRIELRIDPGVGSHCWEYLSNPFEQAGNQPAPPLAVYADAPLFRFYPNVEAATAVQAKPLRILVAICNPSDLGPDQGGPSYVRNLTRLDAAGLARQMDAIKPALDRLHQTFGTEYEILGAPDDAQPVTFARLTQKLKERWHVLHIVAHGVMVKERYYLIVEDEHRRSYPVPPEAFEVPAFRQHLRLAVLSSCQSAVRERDAQQNLPSLAERLVRQGLQAVIAMQDVISIDADQLFVQRFYEDLARTGRIDMAMASARFDLYRDKPHGRDWGYPALFMSTEDGALLEVAPAPPGSAGHERIPLEELKKVLKPLEEDPGLPARVLSNSIQGRVQAVTDDAQLLSRLAAAIAPHTIQQAVKAPPLARRQVRADLEPLQAVQFDGAELAGFVWDDPNNPMKVPERVFYQIAAALNGGKHMVLTGAPGTGKTTLAEYVCRYARDKAACARGYVLTTATSDWTTFDTVGGLVPAESGVLQFQPGTVLEAISSGRWLILDEINRAEIDKAFGELFTVLSGQAVQLPHKVEGQRVRILPWRNAPDDQHFDYGVHPSWRIIGTMNVYDKSYLFNMSFAFMRRFAFVDLDLPAPDQYSELVDGWLDEAGVTPAMGRLSLKDGLSALLRQDSRLMLRRAIGPAIARDVVWYIGQRAGTQNTSPLDLLGYLAEAFQLYVTPQLDNLDRPGIGGIYQDIDSLFQDLKGNAASDEQRKTHALTLLRIRQLYPHIPAQDWDEFLSSQGS